MLKILLIDDEERATDSLQRVIERFIAEDVIIKSCNDSRKAAELIHQFNPQLIFLDIRMPHLNGFDVLEKIPNKNFKVIFTTAYDEYAIKAIRFSAFDYLLKPVDAADLIKSIDRFRQTKEQLQQHEELFNNLSINMQAGETEPFRLAIPSREGVYFFMPAEIIRCEAISNYTKFYIAGNKQQLSSKTLGEYEELLSPYNFIRTHKSHLVNKAFISFIDHSGYVVLKDGTKVEVSRRRKEEVVGLLKN